MPMRTGSEFGSWLPKLSFTLKSDQQGSYHTNCGTVSVVLGWKRKLEDQFCLPIAKWESPGLQGDHTSQS